MISRILTLRPSKGPPQIEFTYIFSSLSSMIMSCESIFVIKFSNCQQTSFINLDMYYLTNFSVGISNFYFIFKFASFEQKLVFFSFGLPYLTRFHFGTIYMCYDRGVAAPLECVLPAWKKNSSRFLFRLPLAHSTLGNSSSIYLIMYAIPTIFLLLFCD